MKNNCKNLKLDIMKKTSAWISKNSIAAKRGSVNNIKKRGLVQGEKMNRDREFKNWKVITSKQISYNYDG